MFAAAAPGTLNHLAMLDADERARLRRRGLAQDQQDAQATQGALARFTGLWPSVRGRLDAMLALPARLQQARADLEETRRRALAVGRPDVAQEAEALYADVQSHEDAAAKIADTIRQWRDTWHEIEAMLSGTVGSVLSTVGGWWQAAKRAVGLGALGLLPLGVIVAAVVALGFVVTGLGIAAWWQTTAATIDGVKRKVLPPEALTGRSFLQSVGSPMLLGVGGLVALTLVVALAPARRGGRR